MATHGCPSSETRTFVYVNTLLDKYRILRSAIVHVFDARMPARHCTLVYLHLFIIRVYGVTILINFLIRTKGVIHQL